MNRQKFDEVIAGIRNGKPDEQVVRGAAKRVFRNVFDSAYLPERIERIRGCSDFQSLMPAFLEGGLPSARVALLEDHVSECVACRSALRETRQGERLTESVRTAHPTKKRLNLLPWALAASLAVGTAIGVTGAMNGLLPGQHAVRATVVSVQGTLYRVSDIGSSLLTVGAVIRNAEELRTAKGSRAIFQLMNGAKIEMGERSDLSVSRDWHGTSVQVERGHVIVQSDEKEQRPFMVTAGDLRIPVRNAVFSLSRGLKGSRVAMASGSARVEGRQKPVDLRAGQQMNSGYHLVNASMTSEFAWSQNADHYRSLLREFSTLQKQMQEIPSPHLRYSSDLAKYLPANTAFYAAIPNVGGTLTEAKRLFDQRLGESEVLRNWWQQQPASRNGDLDRALTQIGSVSQYLGDEIVIAFTSPAPHEHGKPVLLADLRQPGLREYLEQNVPSQANLRIISGSGPVTPVGPNALFVSLDNNVLIASPGASEVQSVMQAVTNPAVGAPFLQTPFYSRIAQSYSSGAGYLLALDMEQMLNKSVTTAKNVPAGFNNVQYLVLERRDVSGDTENRAALSFSGVRQGIASWLGAPGPMGSLDFISPDANFAAALVMKTPLTIVQELIGYASQNDAHAGQNLSDMQSRLGVSLADDIAEPLGGDATFAIDGPLLPIPSWKLVIEVDDPMHLQQTITTLVDHFNQHADAKTGKLQLQTEQVNSRTFYSLRSDKSADFAAYYTFVDGYLLAGPSQANLLQAISNRENGYTLASSSTFRNQLPGDSYTNFSAIIYHNAGKSLTGAADQLRTSGNLSSSQQRALAALAIAGAPGLICVYGEPDRIVAATKGSFLGFNLGTLAGIEQGQPVLPLIASSAKMSSSLGDPKLLRQ